MSTPWIPVEPDALSFGDDGTFPNSPLPLLLYHQVQCSSARDLANAFEQRLEEHGWSNAWRNGVYPFPHYHSTAHEVLAVYKGHATLQLGGPVLGKDFEVRKGDVIVIPAGVCHQNLGASSDFGVLGAYPDGQHWDLLRGAPAERPQADQNIYRVPIPIRDPLFGAEGPLRHIWGL